jgi:hypothetical protein
MFHIEESGLTTESVNNSLRGRQLVDDKGAVWLFINMVESCHPTLGEVTWTLTFLGPDGKLHNRY